jgi:hypothetical protein
MLQTRSIISNDDQFSAYVTFCAATVMLVYAAQNPDSSKSRTALKAAEKCCSIEKMLAGENNKMAQRYASALEVCGFLLLKFWFNSHCWKRIGSIAASQE